MIIIKTKEKIRMHHKFNTFKKICQVDSILGAPMLLAMLLATALQIAYVIDIYIMIL
jgi:hypothetical protein